MSFRRALWALLSCVVSQLRRPSGSGDYLDVLHRQSEAGKTRRLPSTSPKKWADANRRYGWRSLASLSRTVLWRGNGHLFTSTRKDYAMSAQPTRACLPPTSLRQRTAQKRARTSIAAWLWSRMKLRPVPAGT